MCVDGAMAAGGLKPEAFRTQVCFLVLSYHCHHCLLTMTKTNSCDQVLSAFHIQKTEEKQKYTNKCIQINYQATCLDMDGKKGQSCQLITT